MTALRSAVDQTLAPAPAPPHWPPASPFWVGRFHHAATFPATIRRRRASSGESDHPDRLPTPRPTFWDRRRPPPWPRSPPATPPAPTACFSLFRPFSGQPAAGFRRSAPPSCSPSSPLSIATGGQLRRAAVAVFRRRAPPPPCRPVYPGSRPRPCPPDHVRLSAPAYPSALLTRDRVRLPARPICPSTRPDPPVQAGPSARLTCLPMTASAPRPRPDPCPTRSARLADPAPFGLNRPDPV